MIRTENLGKRFDDFWAVRDLTLTVRAGEVLALLGPNGAGKTTTVRMLTSVLRPTTGRAWVAGYDVVAQPAQVRASVGVLTEHHGLYNRMPAIEYLDFFAQLYRLDRATRRARIAHWLEVFGLAAFAHQRIGEFSKGMRQKLALARALIHEPPVLLLDEPTSAMDPESARLVRDAIQQLRSQERAVVICTHNLVEAEALADRIAIIRRGRIVALGTTAELAQRYLGPPEYRLTLGGTLNGQLPDLPSAATVRATGDCWIQYATTAAEQVNPQVVQAVVAQGWPVIQLEQVPHTLEQVYLRVMQRAAEEEARDG